MGGQNPVPPAPGDPATAAMPFHPAYPRRSQPAVAARM